MTITLILAIAVLAAVLVIGYLLVLLQRRDDPPARTMSDIVRDLSDDDLAMELAIAPGAECGGPDDPTRAWTEELTSELARRNPPNPMLVDEVGNDLTASEGGTEFLYLNLDDVAIRVAEQPDGTATIWWTDYVANDWAETYKDVATAMLRLAVLLACRQTDWAAGFASQQDEFAAAAHSFLHYHANTNVVDPNGPDTEVASVDAHGRPILTVGQLRRITALLDDHTHVVMDDPSNHEWVNIGSTGVPNVDRDPWQALTFIAGEPFDTRQF